jgi:hypothetical protein
VNLKNESNKDDNGRIQNKKHGVIRNENDCDRNHQFSQNNNGLPIELIISESDKEKSKSSVECSVNKSSLSKQKDVSK